LTGSDDEARSRRASADFMTSHYANTAANVIGRRLFDLIVMSQLGLRKGATGGGDSKSRAKEPWAVADSRGASIDVDLAAPVRRGDVAVRRT
jgi:hypothetical protein